MKIKNNYYKDNKVYNNKKIIIKEYFKEIKNFISKQKKIVSLCDVGCASGDFVNFIKEKNINVIGIDKSPKLLKHAKQKNPDLKFYRYDLKKNINLKKKYDIVTCLGTMTIFDNWKLPLKNLFKLCKKNGVIILYDPLNIYNVDTIIRFKNSKNWLSGFNLFSKKTIKKYIKEINKKSVIRFERFNPKLILKKNKDSMRAWSVKINNSRRIMVGTSQILDFHIIKIKNV